MSIQRYTRKYYKRSTVEESWTQPVLSSNGTIGGNSFACAASTAVSGPYTGHPYQAFRNTIDSRYWSSSNNGAGEWLEWYNPTLLKISQIQFETGLYDGYIGCYGVVTSFKIQACNDNSNWIDVYTGTSPSFSFSSQYVTNIISLSLSENYKYWRILTLATGDALGGGSANNPSIIRRVTITATQVFETITEGTPEDYDFYEDVWEGIDEFYKGSTKIASIYKGRQLVFGPHQILYQQNTTGTHSIHLEDDFYGSMLFVGNGGPGNSSQKDSQWWYASGGSGACFEGTVRLPAGDYTLVIGTLGYGNNADNTHFYSGGVASTDSYLQDSNGNTLITVGCGAKGDTNYTSTTGGVGGTLTLGTLDVVESTIARNGNQTQGNSAVGSLSAYDNTYTGYGAGTCGQRGQGNVYGVAGIFRLQF